VRAIRNNNSVSPNNRAGGNQRRMMAAERDSNRGSTNDIDSSVNKTEPSRNAFHGRNKSQVPSRNVKMLNPDNNSGFNYKDMLNKKYAKKQEDEEDDVFGDLVLPGLGKNNSRGGNSPIMGS